MKIIPKTAAALSIPLLLLLAGCSLTSNAAPQRSGTGPAPEAALPAGPTTSETLAAARVPAQQMPKLPKVDHIVIVIEENHSYQEIVGNRNAPYMNQLFREGASLNDHYAIEHPSQPNYMDLFSGSNQGFTDDKSHPATDAPNLGSELIAKGLTFGGYSEGLPKVGFEGGYALKTKYAKKHSPWANFSNLPAKTNMPLTSWPSDLSKLPTVSFVIPNLDHDIHDGTIASADSWLKAHMSGYVTWAAKHNSLLILTWDEDDRSAHNRIPTVFVGPMVKKGAYNAKSNHFTVLRTIEDLYGLKPLGQSRNEKPLPIWT